MKLHNLGTGSPRPNRSVMRYGTSSLLEIGNEFIMVDCGPGTTYKMARIGLSPTQVNTLFITHHHTDHNVDFPCFALLRFDLDNNDLAPLKVFGPTPIKEFVDHLVGDKGVFSPDIISRQEHPIAQHNYLRRGGTLPRPKVKTEVYEIDSGYSFETDTWKVTAVQVPHLEPYLVSLAYRIDTEEGNVLFLGDAGICPELIKLAKGVDTLVTGILGINTRTESDPHHNVSADIPDIIDVTADSGISRVVGIHGSPGLEHTTTLLRKGYNGVGFDGEIVCPDELTTIEL